MILLISSDEYPLFGAVAGKAEGAGLRSFSILMGKILMGLRVMPVKVAAHLSHAMAAVVFVVHKHRVHHVAFA